MGIKIQRIAFVILTLLLVAARPASAQNSEQKDSLIRLVKGSSVQIITDENDHVYRKATKATFLHNGAYMKCDTALWNVDGKIVNAIGHVSLTQEGTVLTSDKMDYYIDESLAQFRGPVVQLKDKDENILRTKILDYNTRDSVGVFHNGASMKSNDGQIIESQEGTYDSKASLFTFRDNVNMFTDSVFVHTEALDYHSDRDEAIFKAYIDFWKEGNMLSAAGGWYRRPKDTFFFTGHVHGLTENQEVWTDSLYYYRNTNNVLMLGNAQIQDTTRNTTALANYVYYEDTIATVTMRRDAAFALVTENDNKTTDTVYFGADTIVYYTLMKCEIADGLFKDAATRLEEIEFDAVQEYRKKAAEEAKKAAEEAAAKDPRHAAEMAAKGIRNANAAQATQEEEEDEVPVIKQTTPREPTLEEKRDKIQRHFQDSLIDELCPADSIDIKVDSLMASVNALYDSLIFCRDTAIAAQHVRDSIQAVIDREKFIADSLAAIPPPDSTKVGFMMAKGNVRIYRWDMQVRCDSMRYCDLDSMARFFKEPVVWNEGNRQYTSDSLFTLMRNNRMERASLLSNAFIITQEDTLSYDQIKGAEVLAYFDSTAALQRFDALGDATALFYLLENDAFATVNKVECKMLSATFVDGVMDRVHYFQSPKNDAYPVVQMPKSDRKMKGFNWQPERRPKGREDITSLEMKPSERTAYESHPHAKFAETDRYFPGYMKKVYKELEEKEKAKKNRPKKVKEDPAALEAHKLEAGLVDVETADSLARADSLAKVDSLALKDSLAIADSLALGDSLAVADSLAMADSIAVAPKLTAAEKRALAKEKREQKKALRIAARDARWAELDARDAAKAEAEAQKALEKKREKTRKTLIAQQKEDMRDQQKLERYVMKYQKQKARKMLWKKSSKDSSATSR